jgi:hypothetical protein
LALFLLVEIAGPVADSAAGLQVDAMTFYLMLTKFVNGGCNPLIRWMTTRNSCSPGARGAEPAEFRGAEWDIRRSGGSYANGRIDE